MEGNREPITNISVNGTTADVVAAVRSVRLDSQYEIHINGYEFGIPSARITFLRLGSVGYGEAIVQGSTNRPTSIEVYVINEKWETLRHIWQAILERLEVQDSTQQNVPTREDAANAVSQNDPPPLLGARAKPEEWFAWFDWYYRQAWGGPTSLEHMANESGKSQSRVEDMHSLYMSDKDKL